MIAFDTNLLVRVAVNDDQAQVTTVRHLLAQNTVFLSRTVLLETEWVLRAVYSKSREQIGLFFTALLELENTVVENHTVVAQALEWYGLGADLADALHLSVCNAAVMHTFDKSFCKAARTTGNAPKINILNSRGLQSR